MPRAYTSNTSAKIIARTLLKNNMNGTATAKELRPYLTQHSAEDTGSRMLNNAAVKKELYEILEEKGLSDEKIEQLLTRNASQNRKIPASNTALDIAIKVKGKYAPDKKQVLNIDIKDPDTLIKTLYREYERIKSLALPCVESKTQDNTGQNSQDAVGQEQNTKDTSTTTQ